MRVSGMISLCFNISILLTSCPVWESPPYVASEWTPTIRSSPLPYNLPLEYATHVLKYCDETGVPVWLACRMFSVESTGNPLGPWERKAVSYAGAQGIAQIMPFNLESFALLYNDGCSIDPYDPEDSIRVGIRYLSDLYGKTNSWSVSLKSYNGGIGHYYEPDRYGPWPEESMSYASKILGKGKT